MKFNKPLVAKLAALVVAILTVYGLTQYTPIVGAVKDVLDTQVSDSVPAPAADAGL